MLYLLGHFECDGHTVHMLTARHLPPPLTSTVMSLFMHAHSSPLSLAVISVTQTALVTLTMAGRFLDRLFRLLDIEIWDMQKSGRG